LTRLAHDDAPAKIESEHLRNPRESRLDQTQ
jgi:hypothetical protein